MSAPESSHDPSLQKPDTSHHEETLPEEPKTPLWVTFLGIALLVSGGLLYLVVHETEVEGEADADIVAVESDVEAEEPAVEPPNPIPNPMGELPPGRRPVPKLRDLRPAFPPAQPQP